MKSLLATLALTTALTLPGLAMARSVTLTTTLNNYGGDGAYLALYVTDASGAYVGSLWMAGGKSKYYEHLSDWYRATGGDTGQAAGGDPPSGPSGSHGLPQRADRAPGLHPTVGRRSTRGCGIPHPHGYCSLRCPG
jgi:uncharacterized protein YraI